MAHSQYLRIPQHEVGGYPQDKLDKVQNLFSKAFGGRILTTEALRWQMEENPCLKARATSLWEGENLIAYNALTPFWAVLHGKEVLAAVSGTSMADEDFPGSSLQLWSECAHQNKDIKTIFGFPNHNAFGITVKYLNHHHAGNVAFWTAKARKVDVSLKIREFHEFSDEYEGISRELAADHVFIKIRKADFLNWRFFQKPKSDYKGFEYEKRGYLVADVYIENGVKQLQVVDILADSDDVLDELLKYAINLASEWNCSILKLWLTSERYAKILKQNGFSYGEHPFAMVVWNHDLDISNSYITMGESDIF